jgi:hypothetical protein
LRKNRKKKKKEKKENLTSFDGWARWICTVGSDRDGSSWRETEMGMGRRRWRCGGDGRLQRLAVVGGSDDSFGWEKF